MRALCVALIFVICAASAQDVDYDASIIVLSRASGAHIVTLVRARYIESTPLVKSAANEDELGEIRRRGVLGAKAYWVRTRFVDDGLICEKFSHYRPGWTHEEIDQWADELFAKSCS